MAERILCILGKLKAGGVENIMYTYYRNIDRSRFQYDFVYEEGSDFEIPDEIISYGARAFKVPSVTSPFSYMRAIKNIIRANKYRIIHSNLNTLSVFSLSVAWICKVKYRILHNHSTSSKVEKKRAFVKKLLRPFNVIFTNKPCACSEVAGRWMFGDRAFNKGKVVVIRVGVDTKKFAFSQQYRDEIRREFNIENKKVIGHVGRFMTQKNHFFLIDLFEIYSKSDKDSVLMLVGDGELRAEVEKYVESKGLSEKVVFTGVRHDMYRIYSAFDVFVLPSLYEGLPSVSMEACASGLPVLLADTISREAEVTSAVQFLPINDAGLWADNLSRLEFPDREYISKQVENGLYNIKSAVDGLEEFYSSCV